MTLVDTKSKGKGWKVEEVFTPTGTQYRVKVNVVLFDLRQALSLRAIVDSFETSAHQLAKTRAKSSVSPT